MREATVASPAAPLAQVALGRREPVDELLLEGLAEVLRKLERARGVLDDLDRLDAGQLIEEPPAGRIHEHGVPLHLEKTQRLHPPLGVEARPPVGGKERVDRLRRAVEDDVDVRLARRPRVPEDPPALTLEDPGELVAQPVERRAERATPLLVPA